MRIVFFGSGAFGLPTLDALARTHEIRAVVSQPDRPAGRGAGQTPTPVSAWTTDRLPGVPLVRHARVGEPEAVEAIRAIDADVFVVIAFGQKLPPTLLHDRFAINLHGSLLPRWRGAAPIHAAILAGDAETGNSVITLAPRMDAGLILAQSSRAIDPDATTGDLHDLLAGDGPALVLDVLARFARAAALEAMRPVAQDEARVTLARKLAKSDAWIDFSRPARECTARVHALNPWPGVDVAFRGTTLRLLRVRARDGLAAPGTPGDIDADGVRCGPEGRERLELVQVQSPGRRAMAWDEFARGQRVQIGEALRGREGGPAC